MNILISKKRMQLPRNLKKTPLVFAIPLLALFCIGLVGYLVISHNLFAPLDASLSQNSTSSSSSVVLKNGEIWKSSSQFTHTDEKISGFQVDAQGKMLFYTISDPSVGVNIYACMLSQKTCSPVLVHTQSLDTKSSK